MANEIQEILNKPIKHVKGVGDSRAVLFHKLGLFTVEDMIRHFPREYEDRSQLKKIIELEDGETCAFEGVIASKASESKPRRGLSIIKVYIRDATGTIAGVWFNQSYLKNVFQPGQRYVFYGKVQKQFKNIEIHNPVYEKSDTLEMKNTCRIIPLYPSTAKLTQGTIRTIIGNALELIHAKLPEILPAWIRENYSLCGINEAIGNIHFPVSNEAFQKARMRFVFEELLILQLGLLTIKNVLDSQKVGIRFRKIDEIQDFIQGLPFALTGAQRKVYDEIQKDMESSKVMNRLVQGDVGSGKTIVALMALFKAVRSGYQGVMMVPTEILAEQHFRTIWSLLANQGMKTALLIGSMTKKEKKEVLTGLKEGSVDIVIGTHALLEEQVEFSRLGLVITDEQHRFGVRQREILSSKGNYPDILVMTATPIPRTLALILYGDLDISVINELPPGRKPVETYAVDQTKRQRISEFIRKKVGEGRQVYIVCPLVEDSEEIDAKSAQQTAQKIAEEDFPEFKVGLIHGKMKSSDKESIMREFVEGRVDILVSTTVIEVGVNVPNATVMVIENAERFGLSQLHQLRGRVGRGEHQSYCILFHEGKTQVSRERMKIMQKTNDGFVISEKDLELRGPGEFFGTRQHGIPELGIANLYKDVEILTQAQNAAFKLLENDRMLENSENQLLKEIIHKKVSKINI